MLTVEEKKSVVIELFHQGKMTTVIAKEVGISRSTVWKWTRTLQRKMPLPKRPFYGGGRPRKIDHKRACALLKYGLTQTQIGERLNVHESTVCVHFKRYGTDPSREC